MDYIKFLNTFTPSTLAAMYIDALDNHVAFNLPLTPEIDLIRDTLVGLVGEGEAQARIDSIR